MMEIRIRGEDGPPRECADIVIMFGGNLDWYIGAQNPGEPAVLARVCTSGPRDDDSVVHLVAMLAAVGQGEHERALAMLDGLRMFLRHGRRADLDASRRTNERNDGDTS